MQLALQLYQLPAPILRLISRVETVTEIWHFHPMEEIFICRWIEVLLVLLVRLVTPLLLLEIAWVV